MFINPREYAHPVRASAREPFRLPRSSRDDNGKKKQKKRQTTKLSLKRENFSFSRLRSRRVYLRALVSPSPPPPIPRSSFRAHKLQGKSLTLSLSCVLTPLSVFGRHRRVALSAGAHTMRLLYFSISVSRKPAANAAYALSCTRNSMFHHPSIGPSETGDIDSSTERGAPLRSWHLASTKCRGRPMAEHRYRRYCDSTERAGRLVINSP